MPLSPRWRWKLDRWRESAENTFAPNAQAGRPRLCPACGKLAGATATKCPECGASLTYSLAAASQSLSRLLPATSPATYGILFVTSVLYAVSLAATLRAGVPLIPRNGSLFGFAAPSAQVLLRLGARQSLLILRGHQWWRLVMTMFLHGGLIHIGFNMLVLMDVGPALEELYGSARYLFLYLATGVVSSIVSTAWNIQSLGGYGIGIGASGALMGLIGVLLALTSRRGGAGMQMLRGQLVRWVAYVVVLGLLMPGIDNAAHFGGLACGFVLGRFMTDREPASASERTRAYALGWLAGLTVLASFGLMVLSYFRVW